LQTTELKKHREEARQQAIQAAKDKAVQLAKVLDATVGKPKEIVETSNNYYFASGGVNGSSGGAPGPVEATPTFVAGKIQIDAAVRVTFELK
jgi:uncharacterized protein YggE